MKSFLVYLVVAALALGAAACQKGDTGPSAPNGYIKYRLTMKDGITGVPIIKGTAYATDTTGTGDTSGKLTVGDAGKIPDFQLTAKFTPHTIQISATSGLSGYLGFNDLVEVSCHGTVDAGDVCEGSIKMFPAPMVAGR